MSKEVEVVSNNTAAAPTAAAPRHALTQLNALPVAAGAVGINAGSVAIEQQRAIADTKAKRLIAREYRRNPLQAMQDIRETCRIPEFAEMAFYSLPRGGTKVTGKSIRLAEELARCWGNVEHGHRELSRSADKSEIMVYAVDLETGTECSRQLTVMHVIDTKEGPRKCRDQKEIDDLINNKAAKQRRGCILAVIPTWLQEVAVNECKKTLAGENGASLVERIRRMVAAFADFGVTMDMLSAKIGHAVEQANADDIAMLTGVYNALREGERVSDHFESAEKAVAADKTAKAIANIAQGGADAESKPAPASSDSPQNPPAQRAVSQKSKAAETESKAAKDGPGESSNIQSARQPTRANRGTPQPTSSQPPAQEDDDVF